MPRRVADKKKKKKKKGLDEKECLPSNLSKGGGIGERRGSRIKHPTWHTQCENSTMESEIKQGKGVIMLMVLKKWEGNEMCGKGKEGEKERARRR